MTMLLIGAVPEGDANHSPPGAETEAPTSLKTKLICCLPFLIYIFKVYTAAGVKATPGCLPSARLLPDSLRRVTGMSNTVFFCGEHQVPAEEEIAGLPAA